MLAVEAAEAADYDAAIARADISLRYPSTLFMDVPFTEPATRHRNCSKPMESHETWKLQAGAYL
jgi:hypothetical protein